MAWRRRPTWRSISEWSFLERSPFLELSRECGVLGYGTVELVCLGGYLELQLGLYVEEDLQIHFELVVVLEPVLQLESVLE